MERDARDWHAASGDGAHYSHLLSPCQIGEVQIKNRLVFLPHFTALSDEYGMPTEELAAYHVERAKGGCGLIVDGSMAVMPEGKMSARFVHAWDPSIIPRYGRMVNDVHMEGCRLFGQLTHAGHTSMLHPPHVLWAPSQMPEPYSNFTTHAMDREEIQRTVRAFGVCAANLLEAGFDGVEIKIAHDGLLRSFASPKFNRRRDEYGGTLEGRMRLSLEVLEGVKRATSGRCPVGVRLCLSEFTRDGYGLEYGLEMARVLEESGLVDYFSSDAGSYSSFWMEIPPAAVGQGFFRPLVRALKRQSRLPVIAFGRIKSADLAEEIVASGEADLVGMARQLIADPETPRKIAEDRVTEVRACIACNDGCIHQVMQDKAIRCIQNPAAGRERWVSDRDVGKGSVARRVVVVGGGPAGMKVAEICGRRGHEVTLLERSPDLGGQVRLAARQPHHEEVAEVTAYLEGALARAGVEVWRGIEAEAQGLLELAADVIIVASGSQPNLPRLARREAVDADAGVIARELGLQVLPDVKGLDREEVYSTDEILGGKTKVAGRRVLVVDENGHWEGAGTAEYLADDGYDVTIITRGAQIGGDLEEGTRALLLERLACKKVTCVLYGQAVGVEDGAVRVRDTRSNDEYVIDRIDGVVGAFARRSRDDVFFGLLRERELRGADVEVKRIGDASGPRLLESVLLEAHEVGLGI